MKYQRYQLYCRCGEELWGTQGTYWPVTLRWINKPAETEWVKLDEPWCEFECESCGFYVGGQDARYLQDAFVGGIC